MTRCCTYSPKRNKYTRIRSDAADYGMPQRRRRTYIVGYREDSTIYRKVEALNNWVLYDGVMAKAFPFEAKKGTISEFEIEGSIKEVSDNFNKSANGNAESPFGDAGIMREEVSRDVLQNGMHLFCHQSADAKRKLLQEISDKLGNPYKVEYVEP